MRQVRQAEQAEGGKRARARVEEQNESNKTVEEKKAEEQDVHHDPEGAVKDHCDQDQEDQAERPSSGW